MEKTIVNKESSDNSKHAVWDCSSSLYDSFELKSFEKQLDSAISSRTLSMPHLSDHRRQPPPSAAMTKKPASRISRSLNRLIRSLFGPRNNNSTGNNPTFGVQEGSKDGFYVVHERSAALSTIPEAPEFDGLSPEVRSLVRRTASDRFSAPTSIGISCA